MYKITKRRPLTKKQFISIKEKAKELTIAEKTITDRVHYIMVSIFKTFNLKKAYWYFHGAGDGETGSIWDSYNKDYIDVIIENCYDDLDLILKSGEHFCLIDGFPERWLFEDFEEELINGKKAYDVRLENEENERLSKKKALLDSAKKKLTKEEFAALKAS